MSAPAVQAPAAGTPADAGSHRNVHLRAKRRRTLLIGLVAWLCALVMFSPVFWMMLTSFHSEVDAATNPPSLLAPLTLDGYRQFFGQDSGVNAIPPLINSAMASGRSPRCSCSLLAVPAAYALAIRPVQAVERTCCSSS
jgi:sorbitol/mannitol transport system permease protein